MEIVFADKFSLSSINARTLNEKSDDGLKKLAIHFYNDAFWFNQMACSSPRLIVWVGNKHEIENAKLRFWNSVESLLREKQYKSESSVSISRMITAFGYAIQGFVDKLSTRGTTQPYRVHMNLEAIDGQLMRDQHCGGGLFIETEVKSLNELISIVQSKDQTMSVFGFSQEKLKEFAWELAGLGIDRIVPIGQALTFNSVWDGYDLMTYFTKEVYVLK
ncbi:acyl-CoA reductase [Paenibacillus mesophilus]|uniref:acyl-CoA reductase n=1 Tax=Paenibacillus mesophilus TaxID=2582849 RepID=UPI0013053073|nr:acyl-CoA reductase [Paenibacillus mesophilus]